MISARLHLHPVNAQVYGVLTASGEHVGNLKLIGAVWKFKAIGYDASGGVIPGGGTLTDRHNTLFASLDPAQIERVLGSAFTTRPAYDDLVAGLGECIGSNELQSAAVRRPADPDEIESSRSLAVPRSPR